MDRLKLGLAKAEGDVDVLLTCEWPAGLCDGLPDAAKPPGLNLDGGRGRAGAAPSERLGRAGAAPNKQLGRAGAAEGSARALRRVAAPLGVLTGFACLPTPPAATCRLGDVRRGGAGVPAAVPPRRR